MMRLYYIIFQPLLCPKSTYDEIAKDTLFEQNQLNDLGWRISWAGSEAHPEAPS